MNAKRAKAIRRMAQAITKAKGLPERSTTEMSLGLDRVQTVNAADTTRGQYIALKSAIKSAY
jgi:hypothetical protein